MLNAFVGGGHCHFVAVVFELNFSFTNVIYQVEGCPMESPVFVTSANLVIEHLGTTVIR